MEKIKTIRTFKELREIDALVGQLYSKNPNIRNTKFGYAYKKFSQKNYNNLFQEFRDKIDYIRVDNALEDSNTKEVLYSQADERGFKYSKEGLKKCIAEENKAVEEYNAKEIEIDPYISSVVPEELTEDDKELLKGLLIE